MKKLHTRDELLDVALEYVQTRGYNAFSFRDLAERVGIKTASIHYHFPTKGELGCEIVKRHRKVVEQFHAEVDAKGKDPFERLKLFCNVFRATLSNGHRMCLGGMLAIEYQTLPEEIVEQVRGFYEDNERWLTKTLTEGRKAGVIVFEGTAPSVARTLFDALEGAMLSARAFGDFKRLDSAIEWHLQQFQAHKR